LVTIKGDPDVPYGGVTAKRYIKVLTKYLPTILDIDSIFIQDNASIYTVHLVRNWFQEIAIQLVDWPPYSPDMNPIENLWKMLEAKIIKLYPELIIMKDNDTTRQNLIDAAQEAWELLEDDLFNSLALGMQKRINVLKAIRG
jgi:transposase